MKPWRLAASSTIIIMDFKDILSIHDSFSFCNSLQFNFSRKTNQSGHREVLSGAPVAEDTLFLMHGSQKFARSVVLKLGGSMNRKGRR